jgi:metal transporter CNNM
MENDLLIWTGIAFCIAQSAFFSGLNLAVFSVSRLRLEIEAADGNRNAVKLLARISHTIFA